MLQGQIVEALRERLEEVRGLVTERIEAIRARVIGQPVSKGTKKQFIVRPIAIPRIPLFIPYEEIRRPIALVQEKKQSATKPEVQKQIAIKEEKRVPAGYMPGELKQSKSVIY